MTPDEIHKWLGTKESKEVGWKGVGGHDSGIFLIIINIINITIINYIFCFCLGVESVGHASGKHIIQILKSNKEHSADGTFSHSPLSYSFLLWFPIF